MGLRPTKSGPDPEPGGASFSDMIGVIEMPQNQQLRFNKTPKQKPMARPVYRPRILSELGCALMWLGTVPRDNRFHEPSIEILERVPWGTA
jgi:hypothetical protein